eukprot:jgi/Galph1/1672/GphlegSOOS_G338.1
MQSLFDRIEIIPVNPNISLRRYLYSVQQAYSHAKQYQQEKNTEREALLLLRIAVLVQKTISKHPDYRKATHVNILKELRLYAQLALQRLEVLKPILNALATAPVDDKKQQSLTVSAKSTVVEQSKSSLDQTKDTTSPRVVEAELLSFTNLRTVQISEELICLFESLVKRNTERNIETCGILAGILSEKQCIVVTTLIIPKQTGNSDSCEMLEEEELFAFQEKKQLMTIGWIHTHPQHACFLSSVDVHTHASFQWMLPEAIAIVIAPTDQPQVGIFCLTYPGGLEYCLQCPKRLFVWKLRGHHPHPEKVPSGYSGQGKSIYEFSSHVQLIRDASVRYEVYDLRPSSGLR